MRNKEAIEQNKREFGPMIADADALEAIACSGIFRSIRQQSVRVSAAQKLGVLCEEVDRFCAGRYRHVRDLDVFEVLGLSYFWAELTQSPYNLKPAGVSVATERIVIKFIKAKAGYTSSERRRSLPPYLSGTGIERNTVKRGVSRDS